MLTQPETKMTLFNFLFSTTPLNVARRELRKSRSDLMAIESDLEMAIAHRELLVKRIKRLENFMDNEVSAYPSLTEMRVAVPGNYFEDANG